MNAIAQSSFEPSVATAYLNIDELYLSELNPRQVHDEPGINALADSIIEVGLIQNLGGFLDDEGRCGIVFGGRRLAALRIAALVKPELATVPVLIAPNREMAVQWAGAENIVRAQMTPAQEVQAYVALRKLGQRVPTIAASFGVNEQHVYRRLRLADMPVVAYRPFSEGKLTMAQLEALALCEDEEQLAELVDLAVRNEYSPHVISRSIKQALVSTDSRKVVFVGLEKYQAAGGAIQHDLFSDDSYIRDVVLLERLFLEALEIAVSDAVAAGDWAWGDATDEAYFHPGSQGYDILDRKKHSLSAEEYEELAELRAIRSWEREDEQSSRVQELEAKADFRHSEEQRQFSGIVGYVNHKGELTFHTGLVRKEDRKSAAEAGLIQALPTVADKPKSAFSAKVREDIMAIETHAYQSALVDNPEIALALLGFSMQRDKMEGSLLSMRSDLTKNKLASDDAFTYCGGLIEPEAGKKNYYGADFQVLFNEYLKKSQDEILKDIVPGAAVSLSHVFGLPSNRYAKALWGQLEEMMHIFPRNHWTPTKENFWGRMPNDYLTAKFTEFTGLKAGDGAFAAFDAQKRSGKAETMENLFTDPAVHTALGLSLEQIAVIESWTPDLDE